MIRAPKPEPRGAEWIEWVEEAAAKRKTLEAAQVPPPPAIDSKLYKAQKRALLDLFNEKCAYCEVQLKDSQPGDIEHFRPKNEVVGEDLKPIVNPKTGLPHPGYYWLAYDWRNLLPSCVTCNRPSTGRSGEKLGKRTRFPIAGERAFGPHDDLDQEKPLLLNPLLDDPKDHLVYDDENGIVAGKTDMGRSTVETLGLNRDGLLEQRRRVCGEVRGLLIRLSNALIEKRDAQALRAEVEDFERGMRPFSAIARLIIEGSRGALRSL